MFYKIIKNLLLIILFGITLNGSNIEFNSDKFAFNSFTMHRFIDESNSLDIGTILSKDFHEETKNIYPFGYPYHNAVWHKFTVTNNTNNPITYYLNNKHYYASEDFDIYFVEDGKVLQSLHGGFNRDDNLKSEFQDDESFYAQTIMPSKTQTIYLKTVLGQGFAAEYEYRVLDTTENMKFFLNYNILLSIMLGIIITLIVYNLFLFLTSYSSIYLLYIGYLLMSGILGYVYVSGYLFRTFTIEFAPWMKYFIYSVPLSMLLIFIFTMKILNTKIFSPFFHKILQYSFILIGSFSLISLVFDLVDYIIIIIGLGIPLGIFLVSFGVYSTFKKHIFGLFYLLSTASYILFATVAMLYYIGYLPYTFLTSHAILIGTIIEGFGFSLLLAYRVKLMRKENYHLEYLSTTDELTKIYNRRAVLNLIEKMIHKNSLNFGIILVDADYFKKVNDTYGHEVGDEVLIFLAHSIEKQLPEAIVGRIGGEEFLVVLKECDMEILYKKAQIVRNFFESNHVTGHKEIRITISAGISMIEKTDTSYKDILRRADRGLYEAKAGGRNRVEHV